MQQRKLAKNVLLDTSAADQQTNIAKDIIITCILYTVEPLLNDTSHNKGITYPLFNATFL